CAEVASRAENGTISQVRMDSSNEGRMDAHRWRCCRATLGSARLVVRQPPACTKAVQREGVPSARADAPAARWRRLLGCWQRRRPCLTYPPRNHRVARACSDFLWERACARTPFATKVAPTVTGAPAWASAAPTRATRGHLRATLA